MRGEAFEKTSSPYNINRNLAYTFFVSTGFNASAYGCNNQRNVKQGWQARNDVYCMYTGDCMLFTNRLY